MSANKQKKIKDLLDLQEFNKKSRVYILKI